MKPLCTSY